jgi:putative ABC transport system permease protein
MPDLRLTIRGLLRSPLFALTAVLSLALGIGANAAMFSILDRVLLRTLPVKAPHELVFLYHPGPTQGTVSTDEQGGPSFSYPVFRALQKHQTSFVGLAGARRQTASISYGSDASMGGAHLVSGNYFSLLGVVPSLGRVLSEDDDRTPGAHPVAVLSHNYWRSRFGEDPSVLNQTLIVNGQPLTIVGVAQRGFTGERPGSVPDIFVPVTMKQALTPDWDAFQARNNYWLPVFGRLKPGTSRAVAQTAINVIYRAELEQDAAVMTRAGEDFLARYRAKRVILQEGQYGRGGLRDQGRLPMFLLGGMTLLVLFIACANVANLQLARAVARTREVTVRLALGASRGQLVRQLLFESGLLAIAGGALGLVVARWTLEAIVGSMPPQMADSGLITPALDMRVLLFALALSLVTGLAFGLYPALQASSANLTMALREQNGQTTTSRTAGRFRKSLVTLQIAVSLLLLVCAGLFGKTLVNLTRVDLGIGVDQLIAFSLAPKLNGYSDRQTALFYERLTERLAAVPGVAAASAAEVPAVGNSRSSTSIAVEGYVPQGEGASSTNYNSVGPGYFRTLGTPLVVGREFTPSDTLTAPKVAIVNEAFVRRFFAGQNPLGRRIGRGSDNAALDTLIVGVVRDAKYSSMREPVPAVFFTPYMQSERPGPLWFYVRTAVPPAQLAPTIRREVAALDANLPIQNLRPMEEQVRNHTSVERLLSTLMASFAGLAMLLAAIGLYGVLAYNVATRTREIGIRMALGARARHVRALVARDVLIMIGVGTLAGLGAAAAVSQLLQSVLFEMQPWDAVIFGAAAALLGLVALAAAYVPSRRAITVDPMIALRYD